MKKSLFVLILIACIFSCKKDEVDPIESHQINPTFSSVTDIEGNEYKTVILDGREWLAENLRTSTYCNGDSILNIKDDSLWINTESGAWSYYDNDSSYNKPFGKLYNFHSVIDERNICPCGWSVPSFSDWYDLRIYLKGNIVAGGKLKSKGTEYWASPNHAATNESGFTALPIGRRNSDDGKFYKKDSTTAFWSSTLTQSSYNISRIWKLKYDRGEFFNEYHMFWNAGLSIRCVKDN